MAAGADVVEVGEAGDPPQVGDPAGVDDGGADVVDQLLLDQLLAVPDRVEDLADRERGRGVLADQTEVGLVLGRHRVLQPERAVRLEVLAEPRRLDRRQPVVDVVQQVDVPARAPRARPRTAAGTERRYFSLDHSVLGRQVGVGRLVEIAVLGHAVGRGEPGHARLQPDRLVALLHVARRVGDRLVDVVAVGMAVDHARLRGTRRRAAGRAAGRRPCP